MVGTYDKDARAKCSDLGLHPRSIKERHHTEYPIDEEDKAIGWAIAYYIGQIEDLSGMETSYDGKEMSFDHLSSADQWTRIARALRVHGLIIKDKE